MKFKKKKKTMKKRKIKKNLPLIKLLDNVQWGPFSIILEYSTFIDIHLILRHVSKSFRSGSDYYIKNSHFNLTPQNLDELLKYQSNKIRIGESFLTKCYDFVKNQSLTDKFNNNQTNSLAIKKLLELNVNEQHKQNLENIVKENQETTSKHTKELFEDYFKSNQVETRACELMLFLIDKITVCNQTSFLSIFVKIIWNILNSPDIPEKEVTHRLCILSDYLQNKKIQLNVIVYDILVEQTFYLNINRIKFYLTHISSNVNKDKYRLSEIILNSKNKNMFIRNIEYFLYGLKKYYLDELIKLSIELKMKDILLIMLKYRGIIPKTLSFNLIKKIIKCGYVEPLKLACFEKYFNEDKIIDFAIKHGSDYILQQLDYIPIEFFYNEKNYEKYPLSVKSHLLHNMKDLFIRKGVYGLENTLKNLMFNNYDERFIIDVLKYTHSHLDYSFGGNVLYRYALSKNYQELKKVLYPFVKNQIVPLV